MASLVEKIGLLVSANLHDLVNQALRANSPAVIEEQIRRAKGSLDELEDTMAEVIADRKLEKRKYDGLVADINRLQQDARTFVQAGNDSRAAVCIKQKQLKQSALDKSASNLESSGSDLEKLKQAHAALEMKIAELQTTRDNVEQALKIAKTKKRVVNTIEDLADVLEESGASGMAEWAEGVKAKADTKLDMTLQKHAQLMDPLADDGVAAELQRMKAEMADDATDTSASTYKITIEPTN